MARIYIDPSIELSSQLNSYKGYLTNPNKKILENNTYFIPDYPKILSPGNKANILVDFANKIITIENWNL